MNIKTIRPLGIALFFILLVAGDLASKKYVTSTLNFHLGMDDAASIQMEKLRTYRAMDDGLPRLPVLGDNGSLIRLQLLFNKRAAFSAGPMLGVFSPLTSLLGILAILAYMKFAKISSRWETIAWTIVLAGATGNLIDKLFAKSLVTREWVFSIFPLPDHASGVVDFVAVAWLGWDRFDFFPLQFLAWDVWPLFNAADMMIVCGAILGVVTGFFRERAASTTEDR